MHIIIATTSYSTLADIASAYRQLSEAQQAQLTLALYNLEEKPTDDRSARFAEEVKHADLFLYDPHGAEAGTMLEMNKAADAQGINQISMMLQEAGSLRYLRLGRLLGLDNEMDHLTQLPRLTAAAQESDTGLAEPEAGGKRQALQQLLKIQSYWRAAGPANWLQFLYYAGRLYGNIDFPEPIEPEAYSELGIIDPNNKRFYEDAALYAADRPFDESKPVVAFIYLANHSRLYTAGVVAEIAERMRSVANVLPIGLVSSMKVDVDRLKRLLAQPGREAALIVNFLGFRLGSGPRSEGLSGVVEMLELLAIPILHPFFLSRLTQEEWEQSTRGLSPSEFLVHVVLPELDGNIDIYPVAAMKESGYDETHGIRYRELAIIEDRVDRLVARVKKLLALQTKGNAEKRLALICYNYPPGEGNLFGGSFLDTFASVSRLLTRLHAEHYQVEPMPAEELRRQFIDGQLANSPRWADEQGTDRLIRYDKTNYDRHLQAMPEGFKAAMTAQWGDSPGTVMAEKEQFLIPGILSGNVFIGLQPTRGIHENPEKVYHDDTLLPTHQYAAYYQWLREEFAADVIVHVGTHGTLEFLPGKENGMSGACFPDRFIGDIPHLYYYYVGNPSEGMIAKRRSHAALISYQSPPFVEAGLYDAYAELDSLVHEYRDARQLDPERCEAIWADMKRLAEPLSLNCEQFEQVEDELYLMKRSAIPRGLHVLGDGYEHDDALRHMAFVLRHDRPEASSLRKLLAAAHGCDYDQLLSDNAVDQLSILDEEALKVIETYIQTGEIPAVQDELIEDFHRTLTFGKVAYEAVLNNVELEGLLRGLNGRYLPVNLAGDVLRNPEILPTGRNMYQLDPRAVPSASAVKRGIEIAANTVSLYYEQKGTYPNTTAIVLWGIETARTQGESIGQIMHYLGVRLGKRGHNLKPNYEIIPLAELGRPRLNVVITISGIFRDLFSNVIEDLNVLFKRIASLDEPDELNIFKKHTSQLLNQLEADGYAAEEALDLACARIFGPAEGEYGTGVTGMIETKNWTDEEQIGDRFNQSMNHVYSGKFRGQAAGRLFGANLAAVDIVSQLRSSHEHEVVDLDHYYEYFGGLSKTIKNIKGEQAEIYISDTTGESVRTEDVRESINRGVRTRLLNPKWIDALMDHPYHGTQTIAQRIENVLGLASTTNKVENWVFSSLHDTYIADPERSKQLEDNNPFAYHELIETMLESYQRSYWSPTDEQLDQLRQKYMEIEGSLES